VQADLNTNQYPLGVKVSKKEFAGINLQRDEFHGEWNYEISARDNGNVIS
jgi:Rhodopirellula transposase DDE domain